MKPAHPCACVSSKRERAHLAKGTKAPKRRRKHTRTRSSRNKKGRFTKRRK